MHPADLSDVVVARWIAGPSEAGDIRIVGNVAKIDTGGGDGIRFVVFVDGASIFDQMVAFDDAVGIPFVLGPVTIAEGSTADFVVSKIGNPFFDSTSVTARVLRAGAADGDGDGIPDSQDLCPDYSSLNNADTDGNGIGDECECGDQTGDGTVDVNDILAINAAIFDPSQVTDLCDTNDDQLCDVEDILGANGKIFGAEAYCSRYPRPEGE
jgi:hypothetical protein